MTFSIGPLALTISLLIYIVTIVIWRAYKDEQEAIAREKRRQEVRYYNWLARIGLEETSYYFNRHGLHTIAIWDLWKKDILGIKK